MGYGIACGSLPTRQVPEAIPMGHYYHPLVLLPSRMTRIRNCIHDEPDKFLASGFYFHDGRLVQGPPTAAGKGVYAKSR
jgi:hypothetical protein